MEAQWKEHFAGEQVLAVRFPNANWTKNTAWQWNRGSSQWGYVNRSELEIRVVVRLDAKEAVLYRVILRKDHQKNDELQIRWDRPSRIPPDKKILISNL